MLIGLFMDCLELLHNCLTSTLFLTLYAKLLPNEFFSPFAGRQRVTVPMSALELDVLVLIKTYVNVRNKGH